VPLHIVGLDDTGVPLEGLNNRGVTLPYRVVMGSPAILHGESTDREG